MRFRVSAILYKMETMIKCSREETKAVINSIQAELEETVKHRVKDVLGCVDQRTQGLKELNKKIDEMQVDLHAVKTSLDTWTKSLQETLADTRKDLHGELSFMFQVEAQALKTLIEATQCEFQMQLKEVKAQVRHGRGTGTGAGASKPPKYNRTT
jgi:chromosome segregation ATPase